MSEVKATLIEAADLLMDISHRIKYGKPITTAHSTFERLAIECREAATSVLPCIFCGKATDDTRMMDDNGAISCRSCGEAEIKAQAQESAA